MNSDFYPFQSDRDKLSFAFESVSSRKTIKKVILFTPFEDEYQVYNLALLDILPDGQWSDKVNSRNADLEKVMATTIKCLIDFFKSHPNASVYFSGSSPSRTRLYRAIISRELAEVEKYFEIYGVVDSLPELFCIGSAYEAFVVKLKSR